jgi:hypothetical protein
METVRVPFAFVAGNRLLPAGTYRVELVTQSRPGRDTVGVVVFRGIDVHSYVSFVARVEVANSRTSNLTSQQEGERTVLREVDMRGARFELPQPASRRQAALESARHGGVTLLADGSEAADPWGQRWRP